MRQCIERAFGIYMRRWGIFHQRLEFNLKKWSFVALVCAKLHNFIIRQNPGDAPPTKESDILPGLRGITCISSFLPGCKYITLICFTGDQCCVISSDNDPSLNRSKGSQRQRRQELTEELQQGGFLRPEPPDARKATYKGNLLHCFH